MNGAKIRLSPEPDGGNGHIEDRIYHNIKTEPSPGTNAASLSGKKDAPLPVQPAAWELSPQEMDLVRNGDLILAKNRVIAQTVAFFAVLSERMKELWVSSGKERDKDGDKKSDKDRNEDGNEEGLPQSEDIASVESLRMLREAAMNAPKISRGENYKGFPWVVLDYPRSFGREDVFAIRTLFWWGHYFSVTLHLKGRYRSSFLPALRKGLPLLAAAGFHICISDDEWRHELASDNYRSLSGLDAAELDSLLTGRHFLKFSATVPLESGPAIAEAIFTLYDTVRLSLR